MVSQTYKTSYNGRRKLGESKSQQILQEVANPKSLQAIPVTIETTRKTFEITRKQKCAFKNLLTKSIASSLDMDEK